MRAYEPALSVRSGSVKELSQFLPFLPNFSPFSGSFPDFSLFLAIFLMSGRHSAPLPSTHTGSRYWMQDPWHSMRLEWAFWQGHYREV